MPDGFSDRFVLGWAARQARKDRVMTRAASRPDEEAWRRCKRRTSCNRLKKKHGEELAPLLQKERGERHEFSRRSPLTAELPDYLGTAARAYCAASLAGAGAALPALPLP
jgi:hypothetical protein